MQNPFARRALRAVSVTSVTAISVLGLAAVPPAGATTAALSPGQILPFTSVAYQYGTDACSGSSTDITPQQTFVNGPGTPPSGVGSLQMTINQTGENELFRTAKYNDTLISDIQTLQYSTYVVTSAKQPPYLRLTVDDNADGSVDHSLYYFPANNPLQHVVTSGQWQTWDTTAADGVWNIDGDGGTTTTLAAYGATNADATIINSFDPGADTNVNEAGGISFMQGCGGSGTTNSVSNIDNLVIDIGGSNDPPVDKYDLEPAQPARSMSITPSSGVSGTVISVSGTDCFESNVDITLGASTGQSGGPVAESHATPAANGSWTGSVTVPANSDPSFSYVVLGGCGPSASPAFAYPNQPFDVTSTNTPPTGASGYREVAADGGIFDFGDRQFHGSTGSIVLNKPIVGGATDKSTYDGYWMVASDGGIFAYNAPFYGSLAGKTLAAPATEIEPTPTGKGYWIVLANGAVYPFGDAKSFGDMAGRPLNTSIIGMSATPDGQGYWLVGSDGGIFNFGDARFFGSTGGMKLNAPVVDLAPAVDNNGYYLVAKDGGVFAYGSAVFKGSTGSMKLNAPVIAMLVNPTGSGYWMAATDGGIFSFGSVAYYGSMGGKHLNSPILDLIN